MKKNQPTKPLDLYTIDAILKDYGYMTPGGAFCVYPKYVEEWKRKIKENKRLYTKPVNSDFARTKHIISCVLDAEKSHE